MVRKDLPAKSLKDLEGRTFALPSKYSNQNLVIRGRGAGALRADATPDRVSCRTLTPEDHEMQQIADMGLAAGILERRLDIRDLVDRRFIPPEIQPAQIDVSRSEDAPR